MVVVDIVHTGATVAARQRRALVDVDIAVVAGVARAAAVAAVAVQSVHTAAAVLARGRLSGPDNIITIRHANLIIIASCNKKLREKCK